MPTPEDKSIKDPVADQLRELLLSISTETPKNALIPDHIKQINAYLTKLNRIINTFDLTSSTVKGHEICAAVIVTKIAKLIPQPFKWSSNPIKTLRETVTPTDFPLLAARLEQEIPPLQPHIEEDIAPRIQAVQELCLLLAAQPVKKSELPDVAHIKTALVDMRAALDLSGMSPEERQRNLTFEFDFSLPVCIAATGSNELQTQFETLFPEATILSELMVYPPVLIAMCFGHETFVKEYYKNHPDSLSLRNRGGNLLLIKLMDFAYSKLLHDELVTTLNRICSRMVALPYASHIDLLLTLLESEPTLLSTEETGLYDAIRKAIQYDSKTLFEQLITRAFPLPAPPPETLPEKLRDALYRAVARASIAPHQIQKMIDHLGINYLSRMQFPEIGNAKTRSTKQLLLAYGASNFLNQLLEDPKNPLPATIEDIYFILQVLIKKGEIPGFTTLKQANECIEIVVRHINDFSSSVQLCSERPSEMAYNAGFQPLAKLLYKKENPNTKKGKDFERKFKAAMAQARHHVEPSLDMGALTLDPLELLEARIEQRHPKKNKGNAALFQKCLAQIHQHLSLALSNTASASQRSETFGRLSTLLRRLTGYTPKKQHIEFRETVCLPQDIARSGSIPLWEAFVAGLPNEKTVTGNLTHPPIFIAVLAGHTELVAKMIGQSPEIARQFNSLGMNVFHSIMQLLLRTELLKNYEIENLYFQLTLPPTYENLIEYLNQLYQLDPGLLNSTDGDDTTPAEACVVQNAPHTFKKLMRIAFPEKPGALKALNQYQTELIRGVQRITGCEDTFPVFLEIISNFSGISITQETQIPDSIPTPPPSPVPSPIESPVASRKRAPILSSPKKSLKNSPPPSPKQTNASSRGNSPVLLTELPPASATASATVLSSSGMPQRSSSENPPPPKIQMVLDENGTAHFLRPGEKIPEEKPWEVKQTPPKLNPRAKVFVPPNDSPNLSRLFGAPQGTQLLQGFTKPHSTETRVFGTIRKYNKLEKPF